MAVPDLANAEAPECRVMPCVSGQAAGTFQLVMFLLEVVHSGAHLD